MVSCPQEPLSTGKRCLASQRAYDRLVFSAHRFFNGFDLS